MAVEQSIVEAGAWAVGGAGISSVVFYTFRHFLLKISRDITTVQVDSGQRELVTGLREEVTRLETLVERMQKSIDTHTGKIATLENKLLHNRSSAIAALAIIEAFECSCNESIRTKLVSILRKMADVEEVS